MRSNFDDTDVRESTESPDDHLSLSAGESGHTGELHRMDPVACRPIIKCEKTECAGSSPSSVVEHGYQAGKKPATCRICGKIFSRPDVTLSNFLPDSGERKRETAVKMSLLPCLGVPAGCLGVNRRVNSRSTRKDSSEIPRLLLCFSWSWCSEQAVATCFFAEVSDPLSCPHSSMAKFTKSQSGSSVKDTRHAGHMPSTKSVPDIFTGVELVSFVTYINRKRRNYETRHRQSKAWHEGPNGKRHAS